MSYIKGYKVFNPDWTCRDFQYEVGKTFRHEGDIKMCGSGFHFCQKASDCFNYYDFDSNNKVAEVLATGNVETEGCKSVTDEITIVREVPWSELLTIVNTGSDCTGFGNTGSFNSGFGNSGDYNSGNWNTSDYNSGRFNTGNCNSGDYNSGGFNSDNWNTGSFNSGRCNVGDYNTGNYNSGSYNEGNYNTGCCNVGYRNAGDFNKCNYSSGIFCTEEDTIRFFNKPSKYTYEDWLESETRNLICRNFFLNKWINKCDMTTKEKVENPSYKITGGYLKKYTYKEAWNNLWNEISDDEKKKIMDIPNFDSDIFKEITGIDINNNK